MGVTPFIGIGKDVLALWLPFGQENVSIGIVFQSN